MPDVSNVIEVDLSEAIGYRVEVLRAVHQWDSGLELHFTGANIEAGTTAQFDTKTTTYNFTVDAETSKCEVPNAVLADDMAGDIKCHLHVATEDYGIVIYDIHIPVIRRPKPTNFIASGNAEIDQRQLLPIVTILDAGKILMVDSYGLWGASPFTPLPSVTTSDEGKVLTVNASGVWEAAEAASGNLPAVTTSDEGRALIVNSSGEWSVQDIPTELPAVVSTDAGKVLTVNSSGVWEALTASGGLPAVTTLDEGKVLTVNSSGVWDVANVPTELPAYSSSEDGKVLGVNSSGTLEWVTAGGGGGLPSPTAGYNILQANSAGTAWTQSNSTITLSPSTGNSVTLNGGTSSTIKIFNGGYTQMSLEKNDLLFYTSSGMYPRHLSRCVFNFLANRGANNDAISQNADLNDKKYFRVGNYGSVTASVAASLVNCPTTEEFNLQVMYVNKTYYNDSSYYPANGTYVFRILITATGKVYTQYGSYVGNVWSMSDPWKRMVTTNEVPEAPSADGTYTLKCVVSSGTPTYSWVTA